MWEYEDDLKDYKFRHTTQEVKPRKDGLKPYNHAELLTNSYGVQAMVLREVGMDENSKPNWDAYHDRMIMWNYDGYMALCRATWHTGDLGIQEWLKNATDDEVLEFGGKAINLYEKEPLEVIGFRVVRCTNVSSGYPVYWFQAVVKK